MSVSTVNQILLLNCPLARWVESISVGYQIKQTIAYWRETLQIEKKVMLINTSIKSRFIRSREGMICLQKCYIIFIWTQSQQTQLGDRRRSLCLYPQKQKRGAIALKE